jgi:nicotinate-nucleotide pyrophosphorylase (carboxylating)
MDTGQLIRAALAEDAAHRDLTCKATIAGQQQGSAVIISKSEGILSGIGVAGKVFSALDANIEQHWHYQDGDRVQAGDTLCKLTGSLRSLLAAERTALNFLQHLSGVATCTNAYVEAVAGTGCQIVDTRKTTPGLRKLEKQAVAHGGGINHRMDLASGMIIKENHIRAAGSITEAIDACEKLQCDQWIEVECETLDEVQEAVMLCPDIILLDNMGPDVVRKARTIVPDSIALEASGNIALANARTYAETGVDRLAVGAITHSAPAMDLSMQVTGI